ncbi:hypothetical protein IWX50DRAFT_435401 [Phyllosticta citricarpa]|uniref:SWIM-type domain-containing protein n=1 Tax=Phyllosticta citricarpa TaxID=55181 RepID=A0ABR1MIU1_9PEZI
MRRGKRAGIDKYFASGCCCCYCCCCCCCCCFLILSTHGNFPILAPSGHCPDSARFIMASSTSQPIPVRGLQDMSLHSNSDSMIYAASRITYNISGFSSSARSQAEKGLMDREKTLGIDYCGMREMGKQSPAQCLAIYLLDGGIVKLFRARVPVFCACGVAREGTACKHIFWVVDKLAQAVVLPTTGIKPPGIKLSQDGATVGGVSLWTFFERNFGSIDKLAVSLSWPIVRPEQERERWQTNENLNDLMSVFEHRISPADFVDPECIAKVPKESAIFKNFSSLVVQEALRNPRFKDRMERIIDVDDFCAQVFVEKMEAKRKDIWDRFADYKNNEPRSDEDRFGVVECAERLRELAEEVYEGYQKRIFNKSDALGRHVAAILISLLEDVMAKNEDAYRRLGWSRPRHESETAQDRNLYVRLIKQPVDEDGDALDDDDEHFVLDELSMIKVDHLRPYKSRLEVIEDQVKSQGAPEAYVKRLEEIVFRT